MFKEFKEFVSKGNVMNLAVGVIIGAAFQAIVSSLVNDILMPIISMFTGKVNFSELTVQIGSAQINYGNFISAILNFLIISFIIFLIVKYMNKLDKKNTENLAKISNNFKKFDKTGISKKIFKDKKEEEPTKKLCPFCLSEIPFKATRCPFCTSDLKVQNSVNDSKSTKA